MHPGNAYITEIQALDGRRVKRIVGGQEAPHPPPDEATVFVNVNGILAKVNGIRDAYVYEFRGIKFAKPPLGSDRFQVYDQIYDYFQHLWPSFRGLRFVSTNRDLVAVISRRRPKFQYLEGFVDATTYGPPCIQPLGNSDQVVGSEDCLTLNVFTTALPNGSEGLPVVVWIHGGNFKYGSASQYGVRHLLKQNIVIVTLQYRLGSLGFLSAETKELPGNAGLFDMAMGVRWVQKYIGFFNGNAKKIVLMGQGTGAASAQLLAQSEFVKDITSGVIAMSGTSLSHSAIDHSPQTTSKFIADFHGCPKTNSLVMVKCLQRVSAEDIVKGDIVLEREQLMNRGYVSMINGPLGPSPIAEGRSDQRSLPNFLEETPMDALESGNMPKIPLLTGVTKDETKRAINSVFKQNILENIRNLPNFLQDKLFKNLLNITSLITNAKGAKNTIQSTLASLLTSNQYTGYFSANKRDESGVLSKVSETTCDAFFNFPAFTMADKWSKKIGPAYLYRFVHSGKAPKANAFLPHMMPLVGNGTADQMENTTSHGDDLSYIFEPQDMNGNPLPYAEDDAEDAKVRQTFLKLISDFVHNGRSDAAAAFGKSSDYLEISAQSKILSKFRYCEMGLWGGIAERLRETSCNFLTSVEKGVASIWDQTKKITGKAGSWIGM